MGIAKAPQGRNDMRSPFCLLLLQLTEEAHGGIHSSIHIYL